MQSSYFSERCRRLLGAETERYFAASAEVFRGVTVNERLLDARDFAANPPFAVQPGGFSPANFRLLEPELRPGTHPWHHAGVYYVQEPSASSAAEALGVRPGDRVLDLCAAPGGKSAQPHPAFKQRANGRAERSHFPRDARADRRGLRRILQ